MGTHTPGACVPYQNSADHEIRKITKNTGSISISPEKATCCLIYDMKEKIINQNKNMPKLKYIFLSVFIGFILSCLLGDILYPFWRMHPEYKAFVLPFHLMSIPLFMLFIYYALIVSYKQKMRKNHIKSIQRTEYRR